MLRKSVILILMNVFALSSFAQGEPRFEASVDVQKVALTNYFEVSFTLFNAEGKNFRAPDFQAFERLSGQNISSSATAVNGVWSKSVAYSYYLKPKKLGKFTIGAASIQVGNKTYSTKPIEIEVVANGKGGGRSANPNAPPQELHEKENIDGKVFVKALPQTTKAFVGQQVILDYKIYTKIGLDNYGINNLPNYDGFFAVPLRSFDAPPTQEKSGGGLFTTKVIHKVALFAQQLGDKKIEPLSLAVSVGGRSRGFIFGAFMNHELESNAVDMVVEPLPTPTPQGFSGGVGKYEAIASANKTNLTTDDALTILLTVTGTGDIKRVQAPTLNTQGDSLEIYEPRLTDEGTFEQNGFIIGKKTFEYIVLPKYVGNYKIVPTFNYFDTEEKRYKNIEAGIFDVVVQQGTGKRDTTRQDTPIAPNENEGASSLTTTQKLVRSPWLLLAIGLPLFALGGLAIFIKIRKKKQPLDEAALQALNQRRAAKIAQKHLLSAKKYLPANEARAFYDELSRGILGYVCNKTNLPMSELTNESVKTKLAALGVAQHQIDAISRLLQLCETALFAGKDNSSAMKQAYDESIDVIAQIEKNLGRGVK